ncbi:MAG: quinone-dependent dihydroorotate dehydrogenase [Campylobacterales bacterium]|nr:quinone-dependent dihydroorotate dehydrogenase [Campylobacterales bacterium]
MSLYSSLKPLIFKLDPENAHHYAEIFLSAATPFPGLFKPWLRKNFIDDTALRQELFGRIFANPVGLAAGFDKNATMVQGIHALGFGFTEIGTLTPKPQSGNEKPRLWRHIEEESLQNAMGFNNDGLTLIERRLRNVAPYVTPIGINVGKNKTTSEADAIEDYTTLIKALHRYADYLVINISSPNTPGLRDLQNEGFITELFTQAKALTDKPVLLKIAPDMSSESAIALCSLAVEKGASGIIATNTTVDYSLVPHPMDRGGLSGAVLREKSFALFDALARELYGKTLLVSVGGIDSATEAYRRIRAGATLVQVYSALVFKGPSLVRDINIGLVELLRRDGFTHISQAIGADR